MGSKEKDRRKPHVSNLSRPVSFLIVQIYCDILKVRCGHQAKAIFKMPQSRGRAEESPAKQDFKVRQWTQTKQTKKYR
jgi:hypothetical protein